MKEQLFKAFPEEVQDLAQMGVYSLLESNDGQELVAVGPETTYYFNRKGEFLRTSQTSLINFNQYKKIHLVSTEEYGSILKTAR